MPTYYARKTGNVNAADVWATTPTGTASDVFSTFTTADTLVANGFTVSLNVSVTVGEVRADTIGGATAGGTFFFGTVSGVTLTANVNGVGSTANGMIQSAAGANNVTIVGNVTGGNVSTVRWMANSGTLNIIGSVTGGTSGSAVLYDGVGASVINITGNITGGTAANGFGLNTASSGYTINITGNVTGGLTASSYGASIGNSGTVTITGGIVGGSVGPGLFNTNNGTTTVIGTTTGGGAVGTSASGAGSLSITRAKGGPLAASAVGIANSVSSPAAVSVSEIEYGDLGASPTSGPIRLSDSSSNVAIMYRFGTTKKNLVDANASGLMPAASNVRSGTVYNGGNSTGTCAVPAASSVAFGVPVGNTTGTAALTPAAVWDYATSSATTAGSMGERLKNASTVASTGQQLSDALTN